MLYALLPHTAKKYSHFLENSPEPQQTVTSASCFISLVPALNLANHHQSSSIFRYNEQEANNHRYPFIKALQRGASYDYRRFGTE